MKNRDWAGPLGANIGQVQREKDQQLETRISICECPISLFHTPVVFLQDERGHSGLEAVPRIWKPFPKPGNEGTGESSGFLATFRESRFPGPIRRIIGDDRDSEW